MATTVARLEAYLTANTSQYTRKMREAEGQTTRMGGVMDKAKVAAIGFGVAGVAVVAEGLKKSVEAALDAQKSTARLEIAFRTAHLRAKDYSDQIRTLESSSRRLGFTDEDVKNSLGSLIVATHSMKDASRDLSVAQDVARFKGIGLEQATKMLTMAQAGSQRATKQLGLSVQASTDAQDKARSAYTSAKEAIDKQYGSTAKMTQAELDRKSAARNLLDTQYESIKADAKLQDHQVTAAKVIDLVSQKLHGQADAYSHTAAGGMAQFRAQITHLEVEIGTLLIPTLTKMIFTLNRVILAAEADWPRYSGSAHVAIQNVKRAVSVGLGNVLANFQVIGGLINGDWHKTWSGVERLLLALVDPLNLRSTHLAHSVWSGFIGGIEGGFKAVKDAITGLFGKVIDWAKHALGISSPSAVFHSIGRNVVRGFINGIGSMGGALKSAVIGLAKSVASHLVPHLPAGAGQVAGATDHLTSRVIQAVQFAKQHGWHGVVTSGFRTYAEQSALYARYLAGGPLAAKPGTSSHERGQAVDVTDPAAFGQAMQMMPANKRLYNFLGAADPVHYSVTGYAKGGIVPGYASGGITVPHPTTLGVNRIPLGRYGVGGEIGHDAPHLWTIRGGHGSKNPIPMRKHIAGWLEQFVGRGLSRAQQIDATQWWKEHWPAQTLYQTGGLVPGYGKGDTIPAMLTPGEMVLNREQQDLLGGQARLARMFGFAQGGIAGGRPSSGGGTFNFFFPGYVGDETVVTAAVRDAMEMFQDRNGRSAFGGGV